MDYRPIERAPGAFQQLVTAEQIRAMCRRAFGKHVHVRGAVELGLGSYNSTFRVDLGNVRDVIDTRGAIDESAERPVILRVAPEQARQYRSEREFMRNEHASLPFLAPIAALLPRTLAIDFTHEIVGRDYMFQTMLGGVPAPEGLAAYPRPRWSSFFAQMGAITRDLHSVRGERFGRVAGPTFATWGEAVLASLSDTATDLEEAGLDAADLRQVAAVAERHGEVLEAVKEPRMLHGDLWTVNVMVERGAAEPTICGVFDCDRTSLGRPRGRLDDPYGRAASGHRAGRVLDDVRSTRRHARGGAAQADLPRPARRRHPAGAVPAGRDAEPARDLRRDAGRARLPGRDGLSRSRVA